MCPAPLLWAEWLSVRASDWYSSGLGVRIQTCPGIFLWIEFLSLSLGITNCQGEWEGGSGQWVNNDMGGGEGS